MDYSPRVIFDLFGLPITETVTTTWLIMAALIIIAWRAGKNLHRIPEKGQVITELLVDTINNLTTSTMGEKNAAFAPYIGTLLIYIAVANLIGLIGFRPPTADLNTTLALALMTFFLTQYSGIRTQKAGYLKGLAQPYAFLLPINIIGEIANPISLAFRLFGNIIGGVIIMSLLYSVVPIVIPTFLHMYFDVFSGLLQSFIFIMLTMVYVSGAME